MPYLHLFIVTLGELLGTSLLELLNSFTRSIPTVSALLSYGVCFYFLPLTIREIPLGVIYAARSTVSSVLTAFISVMILKEALNIYSIIGLILIIIGAVTVSLLGNAGH